MRKILCLDYHFPPLIGGWWIGLGVIKFLPEFGWQPTVVSAAESVSYGKDYSLLSLVPEGIEVHRVGHREPSRVWQYARNKLRIGLDFPDYYKSWRSPALREAREVLRGGQFDLIFSASEPYTSHFIAMKLKQEFNIPWVAEFGDAWSGNNYSNLVWDQTLIKPLRRLQKRLIENGERSILKAADRVIVIHRLHKQQLCDLYGFKEKVEVVTDGYDESDFAKLKLRPLYPDRMTIVFIGSVYGGQEEIVPRFLKVVNELDKDAEVVFIGRGTAGIPATKLQNLTNILHLPKEKALSFASGADFFLLLTLPSAKWHTPSKTYEYLRLGKPILAFVAEDGDAARVIKEAKAGYVLSYDPEEMKRQLKPIFQEWREGKFKDFHPDWDYVAQFERRKLVQKIAAVFDEVAAQRSGC